MRPTRLESAALWLVAFWLLYAELASALCCPVATVWLTLGNESVLLEQQSQTVQFKINVEESPSSYVVEVDVTRTFQSIDGFGAALTDSSAWLLGQLKERDFNAYNDLLQSLFGSTSGIGLSVLRLPASSCDFSLYDYTYDDAWDDYSLAQESIKHDLNYTIPVLRDILSINPSLLIISTPWTPPIWMKNSSSWGDGTLLPNMYEVYANFFVKYLEAYASAGVPIWALTLQNEPLYQPGSYPGMYLSPQDEANLVKLVGPALHDAGLSTKLLVYDHNWDRPDYPEFILSDNEAAGYVSGSAFHCYAGNVSAQSQVKEKYPNFEIHLTECSGGAWAPNFWDDLYWDMTNLFMGGTNNWAQTVLLWNLALDSNYGPTNGGCLNCRGVVTINSPTNITNNVEYYGLGHFSKFFRFPLTRVLSSATSDCLNSAAFLNVDGTVQLVVMNYCQYTVPVTIIYKPYSAQYEMAAQSVATLIWNE